jgi:hypothetical protein
MGDKLNKEKGQYVLLSTFSPSLDSDHSALVERERSCEASQNAHCALSVDTPPGSFPITPPYLYTLDGSTATTLSGSYSHRLQLQVQLEAYTDMPRLKAIFGEEEDEG